MTARRCRALESSLRELLALIEDASEGLAWEWLGRAELVKRRARARRLLRVAR